MTKILTARKYKSNNPFTKYMQKNIEERYLVYHEDWKKFEQVKQKLIKEGWQVKVWNVVEENVIADIGLIDDSPMKIDKVHFANPV